MADLILSIADGILDVTGGGRTGQFASTDYKAKSWRNGDRDGLVVFPIDGESNPWADGTWTLKNYIDLTLVIDGITVYPISVDDAVSRFNRAAGTSIGYNTQYPQHIISEAIAVGSSAPVQLTLIQKAGYLTISAPETNINDVYVGASDVDVNSYHLIAGKDVYMELDDLSKLWVLGGDTHCEIYILGAFKY